LADYVVTECGFGADLGAEKFFDIVSRSADIYPSTVVIVATCRAIKLHGGVNEEPEENLYKTNIEAFKKGMENLEAHINNMNKFGVPIIVAINKFPKDSESEISLIFELCEKLNVECASHDAFLKGGDGAIELAQKIVSLADNYKNTKKKFLYELSQTVEQKISAIATKIYGAKDVYFEKRAMAKIKRFTELGYGNLPICIAKTQSSLSDNPRVKGVPTDWSLTVTDAKLSAGAGFLVIVCGDMMLMPGLPKVPAAVNMDVDENGEITGLF
ncbi:MAG: formate--tetrahydrofolate ligase, partial [Ignavibacteriae bacterium]|nr:formate--tetrahydrofolate ligase [Ignavibacteriota bacterium]